jgi:hypothetical protein
MSVILALGRQRQADHIFEASLGSISKTKKDLPNKCEGPEFKPQ